MKREELKEYEMINMCEEPMNTFGRIMKKSRWSEEKPPDIGGTRGNLGWENPKHAFCRNVVLNIRLLNNPMDGEWGDDDMEIRKEDVRIVVADGVISIDFLDRVYALIEESMAMTLFLKLLGKRIVYNALWNKVCLMWKPSKRFQLMDIKNNYYLENFESISDYNNVLSKGL